LFIFNDFLGSFGKITFATAELTGGLGARAVGSCFGERMRGISMLIIEGVCKGVAVGMAEVERCQRDRGNGSGVIAGMAGLAAGNGVSSGADAMRRRRTAQPLIRKCVKIQSKRKCELELLHCSRGKPANAPFETDGWQRS